MQRSESFSQHHIKLGNRKSFRKTEPTLTEMETILSALAGEEQEHENTTTKKSSHPRTVSQTLKDLNQIFMYILPFLSQFKF